MCASRAAKLCWSKNYHCGGEAFTTATQIGKNGTFFLHVRLPLMPDVSPSAAYDPQESTDLVSDALSVSRKVVLVIDLVESVRLMAADEAATVARWHRFLQQTLSQTIPNHDGRLIKSLGDGLLVEFAQPRHATLAAHAMHAAISAGNAGLPPERQMHLRAGINDTLVYVSELDIFGAGVNLAARLAALADPGDTVVSATVRDGLTDGLDASLEDMGDCYLKHLDEPVRAFKAGPVSPVTFTPTGAPAQPAKAVWVGAHVAPLQPLIAVIPFESRSRAPEMFALGELIADGVISKLSASENVRTISRSSASQLRDRRVDSSAAMGLLKANYLIAGSYLVHDQTVLVFAELIGSDQVTVLWSGQFSKPIADLFSAGSELISEIAESCFSRMVTQAAQKASAAPLPTLRSFELWLAGTSLVHRNSRRDFDHAKKVLEELTQRHPRAQQGWSEMSNWCVLSVVQGWTPNSPHLQKEALRYSETACHIAAGASRPLTMRGLVQAYLMNDFEAAKQDYETSLATNPSDAWASLLLGTTHAFLGLGDSAVALTTQALTLSPLDPVRYFFESLAATACLSAGQYSQAVALAQQSLKRNALHTSTWRALAIGSALAGDEALAHQAVGRLLSLEPSLTTRQFLSRYPGRDLPHAQTYAQALRSAGLPS